MLCHCPKVLTHPAAPKSLMVDCVKGHNYRLEALECLHVTLGGYQ